MANVKAEYIVSARAKIRAGERLTQAEEKAVATWERGQAEEWGAKFVEDMPKGWLCDQLGTSQKVMLEKSRAFGLGYHTSGKTCNPVEMIRGFMEWTKKHAAGIHRMVRSEQLAETLGDEDESLDFWQCELVKERTLKERDGRFTREQQNLPRDIIHWFFSEHYIAPFLKREEQLVARLGGREDATISVREVLSWYQEDRQAGEEAVENELGDNQPEETQGQNQIT